MSEYAKGDGAKDASYAKGGSTLGRTREFLKESDGKDQNVIKRADVAKAIPDTEDYCKSKSGKDPEAKRTGDKCLPTVKPRK